MTMDMTTEMTTEEKKLPGYLLDAPKNGHIYGTLSYNRRSKCWTIKGEPCVTEMAARLFPGSQRRRGEARFTANRRIIGDVNWLMLRYPLEIAPRDRALWENALMQAREHAIQRAQAEKLPRRSAPPEGTFEGELREFQKEGLSFLLANPRTLLADEMGLGKTVQVLSYLLALREQGGNSLPSLIVCPASLVLNWAEECQKFTPELNCVVVDGDAAHRAQLAEQWDGADVVVTSYDLLRRDETLYENQKFYACILDEAQAIKNHTTQKYKAVCGVNSRVRFALTGTPVENRLGELWSIFSFLMPGYLPPYKSFCSRFEKPITQENDPAAVRRLNQLTGPFILRRMKSEVLKELPPKTENVYRIELEEEQRKLYLAAVVDAREKLRAAKPEDKMAVFAVLMRLREICCDPRLIADNWTGGSAKLDACIELVTSAVESGHRILLFSQFTSMLELLAKRLDAEGVSHFTLQGSTPKPVRAELVRRFNGGKHLVVRRYYDISILGGNYGLPAALFAVVHKVQKHSPLGPCLHTRAKHIRRRIQVQRGDVA